MTMVNDLAHGFYPVSGLGQFVLFIEHGYWLPASSREPMTFSPYYKFYLNSGRHYLTPEDEKTLPKGYKSVPADDPRIKNRYSPFIAQRCVGATEQFAPFEIVPSSSQL